MKAENRDRILLLNGKRVYCESGVIGIGPASRVYGGFTHDITRGMHGKQGELEFDGELPREMTKKEKLLLANVAIERWLSFIYRISTGEE